LKADFHRIGNHASASTYARILAKTRILSANNIAQGSFDLLENNRMSAGRVNPGNTQFV